MTTIRITPDPTCEYCNGSGSIAERVPYGIGVTAMDLICECIYGQLTESQADEPNLEIKVIDGLPDFYETQDSSEAVTFNDVFGEERGPVWDMYPAIMGGVV